MEKMMEDIRAEQIYQRKLLEDIYQALDEIRARSGQSRNTAQSAMAALMDNPMIKAHPMMKDMLTQTLSTMMRGGAHGS